MVVLEIGCKAFGGLVAELFENGESEGCDVTHVCVRGLLAGPSVKEAGLVDRDLEVRLSLLGVIERLSALCGSVEAGGEAGC